jgi:hypothetical protein
MMTDMVKTLREHLPSAEEVLQQVGLERKHRASSLLTVTAAFALGAIIGAALAAALTPRSGHATRQALRERLHTARKRVTPSTDAAGAGLTNPREPAGGWPEGVASSG